MGDGIMRGGLHCAGALLGVGRDVTRHRSLRDDVTEIEDGLIRKKR